MAPRMRPAATFAALTPMLLAASAARADEGMWPFDQVPAARIQKEHGFAPTPEFLAKLQAASVRLSSGGSGSFVSPKGLLLTNHHVAADCIAKVAAPGRDYMGQGFLAGRDSAELPCPDLEAMVLVSMEDVTEKVRSSRKEGMDDVAANAAAKAEMNRLESECSARTKLKCEAVTFYAGGKYALYAYRRYVDVRLVFAPEAAIAFFGGDRDNFTYPRFDLDMALFRVYEGGAALATPAYLPLRASGAKEGETVFVSGHPGRTDRMATVAQLERFRDVVYPQALATYERDLRSVALFEKEGTEAKREAREVRFGLENSQKAVRGYLGGLRDAALMKKRADEEKALRAAIAKDPALAKEFGTVFDDVARVQARLTADLHLRYRLLERGPWSALFGSARALVRLADELEKPSDQRLREYGDANLDSVKLEVLSAAPVYGGVEVALLRAWLEAVDHDLPKGDPLRATILGGEAPDARARELVVGSRLFDVYARRALLDGGRAAVERSTDPMVVLLRAIDPAARAARSQYEDSIEAPMRTLGQKVARAHFAVKGPEMPPDATFTLRLSVGRVKGYSEGGKTIAPFTDFAGPYAKATGKEPYALPPRWIEKKPALDMKTALNFVSTNDIIGGNSGSPVVSTQGELVGLIFDGNLSSLPNRFAYREVTERAVSVDAAGMLEALRKVYGADALVKELGH